MLEIFSNRGNTLRSVTPKVKFEMKLLKHHDKLRENRYNLSILNLGSKIVSVVTSLLMHVIALIHFISAHLG